MVVVILHKIQPNISSHSGKKVDFNDFAIFCIGGQLGLSTRLNFYQSEALQSIMLHVKFEIH